MFSDPMTKVDKLPSRTWLTVAAGMTFMLLLVALFQVVNGQVEQAGIRLAQQNAAQTAIAGCAASYSGAVRRQCMERVNAGFTLELPFAPRTETSVQAMPNPQGFVQTAVNHR